MGFNLADYEPVEDRLREFWAAYPCGAVETDLVFFTDARFIVKATIYAERNDVGPAEGNQQRLLATGYAEEYVTPTGVNKTSALENCETSAVGRALANAGYATKGKRPSREEMEKVARREEDEANVKSARDDLRAYCEGNQLDRTAVSAAYQRVHGISVMKDPNPERIRGFMALLKEFGPEKVLSAKTAEEVKKGDEGTG